MSLEIVIDVTISPSHQLYKSDNELMCRILRKMGVIIEVSCALVNEINDMIVRIYKLINATEHDNMKRKLRDL